ncbi:hypothetical protein [Amycolatopsis taiwanensis]|uniref:Uncharacterized protein n=1 Tax=Amycolatopsis taiwanensis TaxID=342230 RepID=A0A9W6QV61_9PSEU|nr:hypothetical protein [Amycolatopsis taiwanensis]GLY64729.1 hypothetical protein Atai01_13480 [Amycolatopsis taiwanensis]
MLTRTGSPFALIRATRKDMDRFRFPAVQTGLVLGPDQRGRPVAVEAFRPAPTHVVVIGSLRFAQLLGFRALALGAHLSIRSPVPTRWTVLTQQRGEPGARPRPELLLVDNVSSGPIEANPSLRPWSTVLSVRQDIEPADAEPLGRADLVLVQARPDGQATLLANALNLPESVASSFSTIPEGFVAVVHRRNVQWVRLTPTMVERHLIGDPFQTS